MAWFNSDGLYIKYGQEEGVVGTAGEFEDTLAGVRVIEAVIDLTTLNTSSLLIVDDNVRFPKNHFLERAELYVDVAATSGGAATLDVGFVSTVDRSTAVAAAGAASAVALTAINAIGKVVRLQLGDTGAGTSAGLVVSTTTVSHIAAKAGTAVFTAGKLRVRLYFRKS